MAHTAAAPASSSRLTLSSSRPSGEAPPRKWASRSPIIDVEIHGAPLYLVDTHSVESPAVRGVPAAVTETVRRFLQFDAIKPQRRLYESRSGSGRLSDESLFGGWSPAVDIQETDHEFILAPILPDVRRRTSGRTRRRRAYSRRRANEREGGKREAVPQGRAGAGNVRHFTLPTEVDGPHVKAEFGRRSERPAAEGRQREVEGNRCESGLSPQARWPKRRRSQWRAAAFDA
jgi:HSP20 family molecular chaperone IbpA